MTYEQGKQFDESEASSLRNRRSWRGFLRSILADDQVETARVGETAARHARRAGGVGKRGWGGFALLNRFPTGQEFGDRTR